MKRMFMGGAAAILGAAALAGCGSSEPESFDAEVLLSGNADKVVETGSVCTFAEGVVKPGHTALLRGSDDRLLGKATLESRTAVSNGGRAGGVCTFAATFTGVAPGEPTYQVIFDGFEPGIFTEAELRGSPIVDAHNSLEALWNR
ncbi:hypothetical protein GS885_25715 [Rhodococcus hoagii]|nr:hypothetical protein [Prescottella equi]NKR90376.1 hypothetical protein [Prescottella equi]NKT37187.1 hypothetical protein [Prescottella equi]NKT40050.1 hypothetical protein [Prescottella equi]NKT56915.1 hypothetical protein [Prescottella equi]